MVILQLIKIGRNLELLTNGEIVYMYIPIPCSRLSTGHEWSVLLVQGIVKHAGGLLFSYFTQ